MSTTTGTTADALITLYCIPSLVLLLLKLLPTPPCTPQKTPNVATVTGLLLLILGFHHNTNEAVPAGSLILQEPMFTPTQGSLWFLNR